MSVFVGDIEQLTEANDKFREVLYTAEHTQLVVMCLKGGEEIGRELHNDVDQFFRIEEGEADFIINDSEHYNVKAGGAVIIPAGTTHNVINLSKVNELKLYTLYSPPNHPEGTMHTTKADADAAEVHHK